MDIGESISDCLKREFYEETGLRIKLKELIAVSEDFFTHNNESVQSILIFYAVEKVEGVLAADYEDSIELKYFEINELNPNIVERIFWPVIKKNFK